MHLIIIKCHSASARMGRGDLRIVSCADEKHKVSDAKKCVSTDSVFIFFASFGMAELQQMRRLTMNCYKRGETGI